MSGKDVIVAAETGSGKTHGYLAPIIDRLTNTALDSEGMNGEERPFPLKNLSLILCPNVMLCEQVVRMVNGLLDEDGNPLLRVEAVCGAQVTISWREANFIYFLDKSNLSSITISFSDMSLVTL